MSGMPLPRGHRAARTTRHEGETMARAKSDLIDHYLEVLWERRASDLLLTAGAPPLLRIDGMLTPMAGLAALIPEEVERMVVGILSEDMAARFQADKEIDFSFNWRRLARFRANAFFQSRNCGMAVRTIPFGIS